MTNDSFLGKAKRNFAAWLISTIAFGAFATFPSLAPTVVLAQANNPPAFDCTRYGDMDSDGELSIRCGGADCDDNDPNRYPGNTEICNGRDEDCDPKTGGYKDSDGDGHMDWTCH